jgi:hypothetical protein
MSGTGQKYLLEFYIVRARKKQKEIRIICNVVTRTAIGI